MVNCRVAYARFEALYEAVSRLFALMQGDAERAALFPLLEAIYEEMRQLAASANDSAGPYPGASEQIAAFRTTLINYIDPARVPCANNDVCEHVARVSQEVCSDVLGWVH